MRYIVFFEINNLNFSLEHFIEFDPFIGYQGNDLDPRMNRGFFELNNQEYKQEIQDLLRKSIPDLELESVKFIRLRDLAYFELILIIFKTSSIDESKMYRSILKLIDNYEKIIRKVRIISDIPISNKVFIEFYRKYRKFLNEILNIEYLQPRLLNTMGHDLEARSFLVEMPTHSRLNPSHLIKKVISNYYEDEFPNLIDDYRVRSHSLTIGSIKAIENSTDIIENISFIRKMTNLMIKRIYSILMNCFTHYQDVIENSFKIYIEYNKERLLNLKLFLESFKFEFFPNFPHLFITDLDYIFIQNSRKNEMEVVYFNKNETIRAIERKILGISDAIALSLTEYYKLKKSIENTIIRIDNRIMNMSNPPDSHVILYDVPNQLGFLNRTTYQLRLGYIETFLEQQIDSNESLYKFAFVNQNIFSGRGASLDYLHTHLNWNLIYLFKEKPEDVDTLISSYLDQITNLSSKEWKSIIIISADSNMVRTIYPKVESATTQVFFITDIDNNHLDSNSYLEKISSPTGDINIYRKI